MQATVASLAWKRGQTVEREMREISKGLITNDHAEHRMEMNFILFVIQNLRSDTM